MYSFIYVGCGGFLGACGRYYLGGWVQKMLPDSSFPYGTMAVNLSGCFIIGFIAALAEQRQVISSEMRMFLMVGMLGGYTTFSSFGLETFTLIRNGQLLACLANSIVSVCSGLALVYLGMICQRLIWGAA